MSGYGPLGFSPSYAFVNRYLRPQKAPDGGATEDVPSVPDPSKGLPVSAIFGVYVILRMALAIDACIIFEFLGAAILRDAGYEAYDFESHCRFRVKVFIGGIGGLSAGIALIVLDVAVGRNKRLTDADPTSRKVGGQAAFRFFLWPGLAALSGGSEAVVGSMLWHSSQNKPNLKHAAQKAATSAIVQVTGAAVVASAPTAVQFLAFTILRLMSMSRKRA